MTIVMHNDGLFGKGKKAAKNWGANPVPTIDLSYEALLAAGQVDVHMAAGEGELAGLLASAASGITCVPRKKVRGPSTRFQAGLSLQLSG